MRWIRQIFIGIITSVTLTAATKYVSPTGSDTNAGTFEAPYRTLVTAVSVVSAGDTIIMRGGVYVETTPITISKSGTSSSRYYLLAYPGERPILDFSSMAVSSSNRGINLKGSYWYIKGIDIKGAGDNGMYVSGSYNTIEHCAFYENRDTGLQLGGGASYNRIINCDSYYNADPSNGNADGFAPKLDVGTGNYFYGCRAWQNSDDGWDGYLRPSDGVETVLEQCWCFKNGYLKNGSASSGNGNGFKMGGMDALSDSLRHRMTLKHCIAFDNRVKGFDQNNNRGSMVLYHCTAYRNGTNYGMPGPVKSGEVMVLKNCLVLGTVGSLWSGAVQERNSWLSPFTGATAGDFVSLDTAGMRGPRKEDGSLPDVMFMHLVGTSQFIDAGVDVGLPYSGSAPDVGYAEYVDGQVPVQLVVFEVNIEVDGVTLLWQTATEINCYGFEIQRKERDTYWQTIGFQPGAGVSNAPRMYRFTDHSLSPGIYHYRLKQIDTDGSFTYFGGVEVVYSHPLTFTLHQNYPNPFNPSTTIEFTIPEDGVTTLKVYDVLGREVAVLLNAHINAGMHSVQFDATGFASGLYFYRLESNGRSCIKKMVITK